MSAGPGPDLPDAGPRTATEGILNSPIGKASRLNPRGRARALGTVAPDVLEGSREMDGPMLKAAAALPTGRLEAIRPTSTGA